MVSLLVEPIKASLSISDTQFALLQGLAFSILYSVLSVPLGWMADRVSRRKLIAAGASVWSIATVACGLSGSFGQLLIARIGVGAGEATLSPSAVSMIADAFPPTKRALPMSIYTAAANIGAGAALVFGAGLLSLVAQMPALSIPGRGPLAPWQMAFVLADIVTVTHLHPRRSRAVAFLASAPRSDRSAS